MMEFKMGPIHGKKVVLVASGWLAIGGCVLLFLNMGQGKEPRDGRSQWAYPSGVITAGRISDLKIDDYRDKDVKSSERAETDPRENERKAFKNILRKDISRTVDQMLVELENCAAAKRGSIEDLNARNLVSFDLVTMIDPLGRPMDIEVSETRKKVDLKSCIAKMIVELQKLETPPRLLGVTLSLSLEFEVRFLPDEEAMGRGYLYQKAEEEWLETLKSNQKKWRTCEKDSDCTIVRYNCERDAINIQAIGPYEEAARKRRRPNCDESQRDQAQQVRNSQAICRKKICLIINPKR